MEDSKKDEKSENVSPPLQIDPKCFQDALRAFFQPIKIDDPRLDFYTMYKREAAEYDADYIKKYDEDLNTTLIFAGLFSAVSSAFVLDVHSKLQPDPNEQSAAILRAILFALNQSAIPGGTPVVPPVQEDPPSEIVTATGLMYASLLVSLLAAFIAMLGKQWVNRYLRKVGGSMIERCGDRQRKFDGLQRWPFHLFVESLPAMLQVALLLLACGLCRYMWSVNTTVAYVLITLTGCGVLFYVGIVVAGMSSYACPFQTPVSNSLRTPWKKLWRRIPSLVVHIKRALSWTRRMWNQSARPLLRSRSPTIPLENIQVQPPEPWLEPKDLATIRRTNTSDVGCVSWILINITDPEALDTAIRLAGMVRWFEDGTDPKSSYDVITSTFHTCFDPNGEVYPGSRDRAYNSARAIMWIHTLAKCGPEELLDEFSLPGKDYIGPGLDHDLIHILNIIRIARNTSPIPLLFDIYPGHTPSHSRWISNLLLHYSYARPLPPQEKEVIFTGETTIPLDVMINRLLSWCIYLESPVEEEVLKVKDKSYHLERILRQLSEAIVSALNGGFNQCIAVPHVVRDLTRMESRPVSLAGMAYKWCSVICEAQLVMNKKSLLLGSLEIGFRHRDPRDRRLYGTLLDHTEYHRELADVVFESNDTEAISDLLHAWTAKGGYYGPAYTLLRTYARRLVDLPDLAPFSPRLRQLLIHSVVVMGREGFEEVGVERFFGLLDHLRVGADEMNYDLDWIPLLLDITQSPEGVQHLDCYFWRLLVDLAASWSWEIPDVAYNPQVMVSLLEAQEWDKLVCWIGVVWMMKPRETEDLERAMVSLFRHQPGAAQELTQWMERWFKGTYNGIADSDFERTCRRAWETAQQDLASTSSAGDGALGSG